MDYKQIKKYQNQY